MRKIRRRFTFANVVSCIALFVALGGAAYAAGKLGKNSVGTKQIKNQAVTAAKIKKGTITGAQISLAKLGTVPSATAASTANSATTAGTANALAAMEPTRLVGASGQPSYLDGSSSISSGPPFNFQPVGFYKDHEGIVHLTGTAKVGTEGTTKGLIFTLPPGFRPAAGMIEVFAGYEGSVADVFGSNVTIGGTNLEGDVLTSQKEGKAAPLSGVTFRAES